LPRKIAASPWISYPAQNERIVESRIENGVGPPPFSMRAKVWRRQLNTGALAYWAHSGSGREFPGQTLFLALETSFKSIDAARTE